MTNSESQPAFMPDLGSLTDNPLDAVNGNAEPSFNPKLDTLIGNPTDAVEIKSRPVSSPSYLNSPGNSESAADDNSSQSEIKLDTLLSNPLDMVEGSSEPAFMPRLAPAEFNYLFSDPERAKMVNRAVNDAMLLKIDIGTAYNWGPMIGEEIERRKAISRATGQYNLWDYYDRDAPLGVDSFAGLSPKDNANDDSSQTYDWEGMNAADVIAGGFSPQKPEVNNPHRQLYERNRRPFEQLDPEEKKVRSAWELREREGEWKGTEPWFDPVTDFITALTGAGLLTKSLKKTAGAALVAMGVDALISGIATERLEEVAPEAALPFNLALSLLSAATFEDHLQKAVTRRLQKYGRATAQNVADITKNIKEKMKSGELAGRMSGKTPEDRLGTGGMLKEAAPAEKISDNMPAEGIKAKVKLDETVGVEGKTRAAKSWQLRQKDFLELKGKALDDPAARLEHETSVELALAEGKSVPPEVVKDYPHVAEEYKTAFVRTKDNKVNLGEISEDISKEIDLPAAPIRMQYGHPGYGAIHIDVSRKGARLQEIKTAGYSDSIEFVHDVASNYDQIWGQSNGRLLLVKRNGGAKVSVIELNSSERGHFYGVTTAFISSNPDYATGGGRKLLWERQKK